MQQLTEYTDAKLRYADLHLSLLRSHASRGSRDDFECANEEAALFHLVSSLEAFLQELNVQLRTNLPPQSVSFQSLKKELAGAGPCQAIEEIGRLLADKGSWLSVAKELRNQLAHRGDVTRHFFLGTRKREVQFSSPMRSTQRKVDFDRECREWVDEMRALIDRLRAVTGIPRKGMQI